MRAMIVALALVLLGPACGSRGTEHECAPVDANAYCAAMGEAYCGLQSQCTGWPGFETERCRRSWAAQCEARVASVLKGATAFDSAAAGCGVEALSVAECGVYSEALGKGELAFRGVGAGGANCTADWECNADTYCSFGVGCAGRCVARAVDGAACGNGVACVQGLACRAGRCTAFRGAGEDCTAQPCDGDSFCRGGKCVSRLAEDAACTGPSQCREGLACLSDSVCRHPPKLGEACEALDCPAGLYCDLDTHTCRQRLPIGASCTSPNDDYLRLMQCEWRSECVPVAGGAKCADYHRKDAVCEPLWSLCRTDQ